MADGFATSIGEDKDVYHTLRSMPHGKSPGLDSLSIDFALSIRILLVIIFIKQSLICLTNRFKYFDESFKICYA